jgi:hypothetical protein
MTGDEYGFGCRNDSKNVRKELARRSLGNNRKLPKFCELFEEEFLRAEPSLRERITEEEEPPVVEDDTVKYEKLMEKEEKREEKDGRRNFLANKGKIIVGIVAAAVIAGICLYIIVQ